MRIVCFDGRFTNRCKNLLLTIFRIRHFAGQVSYAANGFMEKNADKIPRYISTGFFQSKLPLIQCLFPEGETIIIEIIHQSLQNCEISLKFFA